MSKNQKAATKPAASGTVKSRKPNAPKVFAVRNKDGTIKQLVEAKNEKTVREFLVGGVSIGVATTADILAAGAAQMSVDKA